MEKPSTSGNTGKKVKTTDRLSTSYHGLDFQVKLLMLFAWRAKERYEFQLNTEGKEDGKFDDLTFRYKEDEKFHYRLLQAKHKVHEDEVITIDHLLHEKGPFSLKKYFQSYRDEILKAEKYRVGELDDVIICTNIDIESKFKEESLELVHYKDGDILYLEDERFGFHKKASLWKFKEDFPCKNRVLEKLRDTNNLVQVGKRLSVCVLKNEAINLILDADLNPYSGGLEKEVIDSEGKKFRAEFIRSQGLTLQGEKLRKIFFQETFEKEVDKLKSRNKHFGDRKFENVEEFAQEIVDLMERTTVEKVELIKTNSNRNNVDNMGVYVLVKGEDGIKFNPQFWKEDKYLPNISYKEFREELLKKLKSARVIDDQDSTDDVAKKLEKYRFKIAGFMTCKEMFSSEDAFWKAVEDFHNIQSIDLDELDSKDWPSYEDDIRGFFEKLVIGVNYSRNKLNNLIKKEMGEEFGLDNSELFVSNYQVIMTKAIDAQEREFISGSDAAKDFFAKLKQGIGRLMLSGISLQYTNKLESHGVLYKEEIPVMKDILKFFDEEVGKKQILTIYQQSSPLSLIKVWQILQKKNKKVDNYIFSDVKSLSSLMCSIPNPVAAFQMEGTDYLILENNSKLKDDPKKLLKSCIRMLKEKENKKIVIVAQKMEKEKFVKDLDKLLMKCSIDKLKSCTEIEDSNSSLEDLTVTSLGNLLNEQKVKLQGVEMNLGEMLNTNEQLKKIISDDVLTKLINGEEVSIGKELQEMGELQKYYIPRTLHRYVVIKESIMMEKHMFHFPNSKNVEAVQNKQMYDAGGLDLNKMQDNEESELKENQDIVLISEVENEFLKLCDKHKGKKRNIHWLESKEVKKYIEEDKMELCKEFVWRKSHGDISKLREFVDEKRKIPRQDEEGKVDYRKITDRVMIVSAPPGMGKSTLLTSLAREIKTSDLWVVRINLVDCSNEMKRITAEDIELNMLEALKFLYKAVGFKLFTEGTVKNDKDSRERQNLFLNSLSIIGNNVVLKNCGECIQGFTLLEIELFNTFFNKGKVVLLFDGFDEISPDYKEKVSQLLKFLKVTNIDSLWVTTRPYNILRTLEDDLSTFSYELEPLSREDQENFLYLYWRNNLKMEEENCQKLKVFIDELLVSFCQSTCDFERHFVSVPLQISMIAKVFEMMCKEFYYSTDQEISDCQRKKISEKMNLIALYDEFFKTIFVEVYLMQKNPGTYDDRSTISTNDMIQYIREKCVREHKVLALYAIFGVDGLEELMPGESKNILEGKNSLMERVRGGKEKTGIVDRIVNDIPVFVHLTYADYFAVLWIAENLNKKNVCDFINGKIFERKRDVTRKFLDYMLARDVTNKTEYEVHIAVLNGDKFKVETLLKSDNVSLIQRTDKGGRTALHLAAAYDRKEIAKVLLEKFPSWLAVKDNVFNFSPIMYADRCSSWNVAELLLQNGANGDDMLEAIRNVQSGEFNETGDTLLHTAAKEGHMEIVKLLIKNNADITAINSVKDTPLHLCARNGHFDIVRYFVDDKDVDVKIQGQDGRIPLHYAAENGHLDIVAYFLSEKEVDVNIRDNDGDTPLHYAVSNNSVDLVRYLVDPMGADINLTDKCGNTPMHLAATTGKIDVVSFLGDRNEIDLNVQNKDEGTPLHLAAKYGHLDVVKYFVEIKDADINIQGRYGGTPVHSAAYSGHTDVVRYFVEEKVIDINVKDDLGYTALLWAAHAGRLETVRYLGDRNEIDDVNSKNNDKENSLHVAAKKGHLDVVKYLVEFKDVDVYIQDKETKFAIHIAAECGHVNIVRYFVEEKGVDVNACDGYGYTPLHHAVMSGKIEVVRYLGSQNEIDINAKNIDGDTSLHMASLYGCLDVVKYFVQVKNTDVYIRAENGRCPLHYAVEYGHLDIVRYFLDERRMELNVIDNNGSTPMSLAVSHGRFDIVKYFVEDMKSDGDVEGGYANILFDLSVEIGRFDLTCYLSKFRK